MRERMALMTPSEFERVLHPIFEQDELTLIVSGAVLGALAGFAQQVYAAAVSDDSGDADSDARSGDAHSGVDKDLEEEDWEATPSRARARADAAMAAAARGGGAAARGARGAGGGEAHDEAVADERLARRRATGMVEERSAARSARRKTADERRGFF